MKGLPLFLSPHMSYCSWIFSYVLLQLDLFGNFLGPGDLQFEVVLQFQSRWLVKLCSDIAQKTCCFFSCIYLSMYIKKVVSSLLQCNILFRLTDSCFLEAYSLHSIIWALHRALNFSMNKVKINNNSVYLAWTDASPLHDQLTASIQPIQEQLPGIPGISSNVFHKFATFLSNTISK